MKQMNGIHDRRFQLLNLLNMVLHQCLHEPVWRALNLSAKGRVIVQLRDTCYGQGQRNPHHYARARYGGYLRGTE